MTMVGSRRFYSISLAATYYHRISILNTIPFRIGVAALPRVGKLLSVQSVVGAKQASHTSALFAVIAGAIVMMVLMALQTGSLGHAAAFSADKAIGTGCAIQSRAYDVHALPVVITRAFHPTNANEPSETVSAHHWQQFQMIPRPRRPASNLDMAVGMNLWKEEEQMVREGLRGGVRECLAWGRARPSRAYTNVRVGAAQACGAVYELPSARAGWGCVGGEIVYGLGTRRGRET
ncbi:hypothetical protein FIBSPDRAFT_1001963 [Athelia psychrophila]|uniref:Uncharacterized protein n=1 Tax=Athelia psychrophila TaxID=1759441 RepID=A0A167WR86_9AGAM|nr:hypothetical protein FIBSPDRAFT_1001963 [Fibularhizoctonia sp. CBS 109695]